MGGSPPVAGAAAAPLPRICRQVALGRNDPSAPRTREWPGRPPVAGQSLTGKDHHQGRAGRVPATRGRPLTLTFPGKTLAPIRRMGQKCQTQREPSVPGYSRVVPSVRSPEQTGMAVMPRLLFGT
jgi:hypothetical protein